MKQNNKRLLSILLSLCMVLSLFGGTTVTASAATGPTTLYVNGVNMLQNSSILDGAVSYKNGTLTLNNAKLSTFYTDGGSNIPAAATYGGVIYARGGDLTINLEGDNTITYGNSVEAFSHVYGILFYEMDLTIEGTGTLTIINAATTVGDGTGMNYHDICGGKWAADTKGSNLIINDATVRCEGDNTKGELGSNSVKGVSLIKEGDGTLTVNNGKLIVKTRKSKANFAPCGISLSGKQHRLIGNAEVDVVAGENSNASDPSTGIALAGNSSIQMDAGASLRSSGSSKTFSDYTSVTAVDKALLDVKGSTDYNASSEDLQPIAVSNNTSIAFGIGGISNNYKTIAIKAKRSGTVTGVEIAKGTDPVTVKKGATHQFAANVAVGEGEPDTTVAWSISGANSAKTTISADGLLTVGEDETAESITVTATSNHDNSKSDSITVNISPAFIDGFGNKIDDISNYTEGTTKNDKGYIFAGWFDSEGNKVTEDTPAANGKTYTARWTNNGRTVRITALDLTSLSTMDNAGEGWNWDAESSTLTLNGCTIDVPASANKDASITLPDGAKIVTAENTENIVNNGHTNGILGNGELTIESSGELSVAGKDSGIYAKNDLIINLPLTAKATGTNGKAVKSDSQIDIKFSLAIEKPDGGKVCSNNGAFIGDSNGNAAAEVVIGMADPVFDDSLGNANCNFNSYEQDGIHPDKGYTFEGWFTTDENGNEIKLANAESAEYGVTYTAKWTNNGKTVRIAALDLTGMTTTDNTDEGWSWDAESKTLTLSGCTVDAPDNQAAVVLPDGAIIITEKDTNNIVLSEQADGVSGAGALTVEGAGDLSVTGKERGIYANGNLVIEAPLVAKATGVNGKAVLANTITKEDCWSIKSPDRGKIISDGSTAYIGNGKVANEVTIGAAELYAVTYNSDGGSNVATVLAYENTGLSKPVDPAKNGYNFVGWYKDEGLQTLWDFDYDIVTSDVTLYAKWTREPVHAISGSIKKDSASGSKSPVEGAKVILKQGTEEISIATTDENGEYVFDNVPSGEYNIVIEKTEGDNAVTKTALVTVSDPEEGQSGTIADVIMPNKAVSSVVEIEDGTPAVLVGGLDDEAIGQAGSDDNVTVKLRVVAQTQAVVPEEADTAIKQLAKGKTLEYLDMTVVKSITTAGTAGSSQLIGNTDNVLEIVVPLKIRGKRNIAIYRHHEATDSTEAETRAFDKLDQRPTENYQDGTYFIGEDFVVIYTQKFSTYAIGYNTSSGGSSAVQKPEVTANGEGRTELSKDGKTMTIIPNEGYEIKSVLVNGKDMGKIDKLTGLKTGDKVVVIFIKAAQDPADMDNQIRQQLNKAQLKARSSFTANRNVKVVFVTDEQTKILLQDIQKAGYTVKYKYTRSTKKSAKKYAASYKQMLTKFEKTYLNTYGKKSTMYYYRVSIVVYDKDGKFVAKTDINQCRYANRLWSK